MKNNFTDDEIDNLIELRKTISKLDPIYKDGLKDNCQENIYRVIRKIRFIKKRIYELNEKYNFFPTYLKGIVKFYKHLDKYKNIYFKKYSEDNASYKNIYFKNRQYPLPPERQIPVNFSNKPYMIFASINFYFVYNDVKELYYWGELMLSFIYLIKRYENPKLDEKKLKKIDEWNKKEINIWLIKDKIPKDKSIEIGLEKDTAEIKPKISRKNIDEKLLPIFHNKTEYNWSDVKIILHLNGDVEIEYLPDKEEERYNLYKDLNFPTKNRHDDNNEPSKASELLFEILSREKTNNMQELIVKYDGAYSRNLNTVNNKLKVSFGIEEKPIYKTRGGGFVVKFKYELPALDKNQTGIEQDLDSKLKQTKYDDSIGYGNKSNKDSYINDYL